VAAEGRALTIAGAWFAAVKIPPRNLRPSGARRHGPIEQPNLPPWVCPANCSTFRLGMASRTWARAPKAVKPGSRPAPRAPNPDGSAGPRPPTDAQAVPGLHLIAEDGHAGGGGLDKDGAVALADFQIVVAGANHHRAGRRPDGEESRQVGLRGVPEIAAQMMKSGFCAATSACKAL